MAKTHQKERVLNIRCSEIWGGNESIDTEVCTGSLTASLYSSGMDGGRGGDIYYFSVCGREMLTRIAVADVTGHGKTVSSTSHWLYRSMVSNMNEMDGGNILQDLNVLAKNEGIRAMTTAEVITYNRGDSRLYFSYAGHPPLLLRKKGERKWRKLILQNSSRLANLPLGVVENVVYDRESLIVNAGDLLFLYTDGVVGALKDGKPFGMEGLLRVLGADDSKSLAAIKSEVLSSLTQFTGGHLTHDDVTFMVVRIH